MPSISNLPSAARHRSKHSFGWLYLVCLGCLWVSGCNDSAPSTGSSTSRSDSSSASTDGEQQIDPQEVLANLRTAYRQADSYSDNSSIIFYAVPRSTGSAREVPFTRSSVVFERPNKLSVTYQKEIASSEADRYEIVSDGKTIRSAANEVPDQIHEAIAPVKLTTENFIAEPALRGALLENSIENTLPQLALLLHENDEQQVFPGEPEVELLADGQIDGQPYYRLDLPSPAGKRVLWVDQQRFTLRRMEIPIENQRSQLNSRNQFSDISVWIDFEDVTLNPEIAQDTFVFAISDGARRVRRFIPPPPAGPSELFGKPVGQFEFRSLDGEDVTPEVLSGKVTVLDFWATNCPPCKAQTPVLNEVYQQFRDNEQVAFLAVSTDSRVVPNETIEQTLASWGGEMPIVRDPNSTGYKELNIRQTPTLILIDREGRLQSFQVGAHDNAEPVIDVIQRLVDGEDLVATEREKHAEYVVKYEEAIQSAEITDSIVEVEIVQPEVAARTMPTKLELKQLWQTSGEQLSRPGALVLQQMGSDEPGLLVLDGGQEIVELNGSGEVVARHELPAHDERAGGFLRIWSNAEGKRWILASGVGWQQVHVFDDQWQPVLSFPDERHSGVGDVLFDDLNGSETPVMHVGYWGGLGVQGGTLDGRRLWANRRLDHVLQLGVGPTVSSGEAPNESSKQSILCTSTRGTLMQLGADGKSMLERYVPGQALMYFASSPERDRHCGLAIGKAGQYTAVGFDESDEVQWEYPLPIGEYVEPLARVQHVRLPAGESAWMVVAADGSIHWLSLEGELIDRFDYGEILTGVAMASLGEQSVLYVSTAEHLTAWQVVASAPPTTDKAEIAEPIVSPESLTETATEAEARDSETEPAQSEESAQSDEPESDEE